MKLSSGWYPINALELTEFIEKSIKIVHGKERNSKAVIVPHAGWFYSGSIAVKAIYTLTSSPDVIVVIGGHLSPGSPLYYSAEDYIETPLGNILLEKKIIKRLRAVFKMEKDNSSDNTVEVHMPIIKYLYPDCRVVCLRIGSGPESIELGAVLYKIVSELKQKTVVVGSTDLTHYGSNFMFSPAGTGPCAISWVKEKNDSDIIKKMLNMDYRGVLDSSADNHSACSSGAASAAIKFAQLSGVSNGELIEYLTSYDINPSESFVGYAGISF